MVGGSVSKYIINIINQMLPFTLLVQYPLFVKDKIAGKKVV
jgi:hypothetical protein